MNKDLSHILGERIKRLRKANGYTQAELSKSLNVVKSAVSQWENGSRKPEAETLKKLADFLNTSSDFLLGRTDNMSIITNNTESTIEVPILKEAAPGELYRQENILGYRYLHEKNFGEGNYYYLKVNNSNMTADHIISGSYVLVKKQNHVENGDIAVVSVNEEAAGICRITFDNGHIIVYTSDIAKNEPKTLNNKSVKILGKVICSEVFYD